MFFLLTKVQVAIKSILLIFMFLLSPTHKEFFFPTSLIYIYIKLYILWNVTKYPRCKCYYFFSVIYYYIYLYNILSFNSVNIVQVKQLTNKDVKKKKKNSLWVGLSKNININLLSIPMTTNQKCIYQTRNMHIDLIATWTLVNTNNIVFLHLFKAKNALKEVEKTSQ